MWFPGVGLKLERFNLKDAENKHAIKKDSVHFPLAGSLAPFAPISLCVCLSLNLNPPLQGFFSSLLKTSDTVLSQLVLGIHRGSSSPVKKKAKKGEREREDECANKVISDFFLLLSK